MFTHSGPMIVRQQTAYKDVLATLVQSQYMDNFNMVAYFFFSDGTFFCSIGTFSFPSWWNFFPKLPSISLSIMLLESLEALTRCRVPRLLLVCHCAVRTSGYADADSTPTPTPHKHSPPYCNPLVALHSPSLACSAYQWKTFRWRTHPSGH